MNNIKVLRQFLLNGNPVVVGEVVPKSAFESAGDWQNLCNMKPARAEETNEKVGKPGKTTGVVPGV